MTKWKVQFFETKRGESPVEEFLIKLHKPAIAKTLRMIELVEKHGKQLSMPHARYLGEGLYELRIRGSQEVRIVYGFVGNDIYLLHAFKKKSQKTPLRDIAVSRQRLDRVSKEI